MVPNSPNHKSSAKGRWSLNRSGAQSGPVTLTELRRLLESGDVESHEKVKNPEGLWISVREALQIDQNQSQDAPVPERPSAVDWDEKTQITQVKAEDPVEDLFDALQRTAKPMGAVPRPSETFFDAQASNSQNASMWDRLQTMIRGRPVLAVTLGLLIVNGSAWAIYAWLNKENPSGPSTSQMTSTGPAGATGETTSTSKPLPFSANGSSPPLTDPPPLRPGLRGVSPTSAPPTGSLPSHSGIRGVFSNPSRTSAPANEDSRQNSADYPPPLPSSAAANSNHAPRIREVEGEAPLDSEPAIPKNVPEGQGEDGTNDEIDSNPFGD